jgi:hypothetical protein
MDAVNKPEQLIIILKKLPIPVHGWIKQWACTYKIAIASFIYGLLVFICNWMMNYIMIQDWPQDIGGNQVLVI